MLLLYYYIGLINCLAAEIRGISLFLIQKMVCTSPDTGK